MSKEEILLELPKLHPRERGELLDRLYELVEQDYQSGFPLSAAEKEILDKEWESYSNNPEAGAPWSEVEVRLRESFKA